MPRLTFCAVCLALLAAAPAAQSPVAARPAPPVLQSPAAEPLDAEIAFLEGRVGRDDADPITPTRLGHAYLRKARASGDFSTYARAEATFQLALARSPDHPGALIGLAGALSARHAFRDALAVAERAIAANPGSADGYAAAGDAALEAGLPDRAATLYARVQALAPGYHADTRLANLAAARGDVTSAYASLQRAITDETARGLSAELIAWCHLRAGGIAWGHGDWKRAGLSYAAARALTPDSYRVLEHQAELEAAQGRDDEALVLYARAIARSAQPEFHQAVAAILQRRGRTSEANAALERARAGYEQAAADGDPGAFRPLALFFVDVDSKPSEAVRWARKDAEIRQDAVTLGVLAWTLLKNGTPDEAALHADRAIEARPVDADTWYRVGVVSMERGDRTAARTRLTRALKINPRFASVDDATRRLQALTARSR